MNKVNCSVCGLQLDRDNEVVDYDNKYYCFDHYEELISSIQDKELIEVQDDNIYEIKNKN